MARNEYKKLVAYALELGLEDAGYAGTGHQLFRNPATGQTTSLSLHIASYGRAIENARSEFRRLAGVDSRGTESVEGERKKRKGKGRLSSGFNIERVIRERKNAPTRYTGPDRSDLAAEREAAVSELLDMSQQKQAPNARAMQLAARVIELDQILDN